MWFWFRKTEGLTEVLRLCSWLGFVSVRILESQDGITLHHLLYWNDLLMSPASLPLCLLLCHNNPPPPSHRATVITRWSLTSERNWTLFWRSLGSATRKTPTVSAYALCSGLRTRAFRKTCDRYHTRGDVQRCIRSRVILVNRRRRGKEERRGG